MLALGIIFTFSITFGGMVVFKDLLPADMGREFAVEGKLSKGKPKGAGIIFILSFALGALLFAPVTIEHSIYILLVIVEMITGYLDDRSKMPWGRLKKGILDLFVALALAFTYVHYNGTTFGFGNYEFTITMPVWLFFVLSVILVWASVNVTNCADGVDGLSGTLVVVTLLSFYIADLTVEAYSQFVYVIMYFMIVILAYLWFNAGPSILLMGDAGSRAMGMFISIVALKSRFPFLYIPFAIVLILDGGLGLFKITCIKLFKWNPMKELRTPLHDHVRKNLKPAWSNGQVVMRFALLQMVISIAFIYLFLR
ncbi:MAG: phospho-N-acetylmuramoyl-pentapeptide-transferase [Lachnospiraceae bacterium]|nr:phospho-N-acetylmuramoyl-pentapeptide-transferase [Lachnospiraceae bacterium]